MDNYTQPPREPPYIYDHLNHSERVYSRISIYTRIYSHAYIRARMQKRTFASVHSRLCAYTHIQTRTFERAFILHVHSNCTLGITFDGVTIGDTFAEKHAVVERKVKKVPVEIHSAVFDAVSNSQLLQIRQLLTRID